MAENDGNRVESRLPTMGRGFGATPERIADIQQRAAELEKLNKPKPTESFQKVFSRRAGAKSAQEPTEKEKRFKSLPKRGPVPGLVHPSLRDVYGRDGEADDNVVIKG